MGTDVFFWAGGRRGVGAPPCPAYPCHPSNPFFLDVCILLLPPLHTFPLPFTYLIHPSLLTCSAHTCTCTRTHSPVSPRAGDELSLAPGGYEIAALAAGGAIAFVDAALNGHITCGYALLR